MGLTEKLWNEPDAILVLGAEVRQENQQRKTNDPKPFLASLSLANLKLKENKLAETSSPKQKDRWEADCCEQEKRDNF